MGLESYSIVAILFAAGATQGMLGFGFGLVSMSLLVFWIDISIAVPLVAVFCPISQILLLSKFWSYIEWSEAKLLIASAMIAAPVGANLLSTVDSAPLLFSLGILLLFYVLMRWSGTLNGRTCSRTWAPFFGLIGGLTGGALNTAGPPILLYTTMKPWGKEQSIATLQVYFFSITSVQLLTLFNNGILNEEILWMNLKYSPAVAFGVLMGILINNRLNHESFLRWMLRGLFIIALSLILQNT